MVGRAEGFEPDRLVRKLDHDTAFFMDGLGKRRVYVIAQHGRHHARKCKLLGLCYEKNCVFSANNGIFN